MKLGFVSAILPDLSLEQVFEFAAESGYDCVEVMCWPQGKAERRYAGVTHLDVERFSDADGARIRELERRSGVAVSALGYYPNPLAADPQESAIAVEQIRRVMAAAGKLGVGMNTFVGRDPQRSLDDNWPRMLEIWRPLIRFAEAQGVRIGIENCPMLFTQDEWPGGKNLATCPAVWRRLFRDIPNSCFGLNYDPSHLVWQQMNYLKPIQEFAGRLFHVHAKDAIVERERLDDVGVLACPNEYHTPKIPGKGDVSWESLLRALGDVGYTGPICVEVEDRAFEGSLESRKEALVKSAAHLRPLLK